MKSTTFLVLFQTGILLGILSFCTGESGYDSANKNQITSFSSQQQQDSSTTGSEQQNSVINEDNSKDQDDQTVYSSPQQQQQQVASVRNNNNIQQDTGGVIYSAPQTTGTTGQSQNIGHSQQFSFGAPRLSSSYSSPASISNTAQLLYNAPTRSQSSQFSSPSSSSSSFVDDGPRVIRGGYSRTVIQGGNSGFFQQQQPIIQSRPVVTVNSINSQLDERGPGDSLGLSLTKPALLPSSGPSPDAHILPVFESQTSVNYPFAPAPTILSQPQPQRPLILANNNAFQNAGQQFSQFDSLSSYPDTQAYGPPRSPIRFPIPQPQVFIQNQPQITSGFPVQPAQIQYQYAQNFAYNNNNNPSPSIPFRPAQNYPISPVFGGYSNNYNNNQNYIVPTAPSRPFLPNPSYQYQYQRPSVQRPRPTGSFFNKGGKGGKGGFNNGYSNYANKFANFKQQRPIPVYPNHFGTSGGYQSSQFQRPFISYSQNYFAPTPSRPIFAYGPPK